MCTLQIIGIIVGILIVLESLFVGYCFYCCWVFSKFLEMSNWQNVRNMVLTVEQYKEFESIQLGMSDWIQRQPNLPGTVEETNKIYFREIRERLEALLAIHCTKKNQDTLRLWCYKYYNL